VVVLQTGCVIQLLERFVRQRNQHAVGPGEVPPRP
jgi:hypothetical protein